MEQWRDQGYVLSVRAHGEGGAIVSLLTENHGRHAGYLYGAQSSKKRAMLELGSLVSAQWSSRVDGQLGTLSLEPEGGLPHGILDDALKLSALLSACSLCDSALPEREGHAGLFYGFKSLMDILAEDVAPSSNLLPVGEKAFSPSPQRGEGRGEGEHNGVGRGDESIMPKKDNSIWPAAYIYWEIAFLKELGFGMDLTRCAGGGDSQTLAYVSPKSGRAVSYMAGEPYKDKLLELPSFLKPNGGPLDDIEILKGLKMTGYFLEHWAFAHHTKGIPDARLRFESRYAKHIGDI